MPISANRGVPRTILLLGLAALLLILTVAWRWNGWTPSGRSGATSIAELEDLTLADVYSRVDRTLRQNGGIYHVRIESRGGIVLPLQTYTTERWVDVHQGAVREEFGAGSDRSTISIRNGDASFVRQKDGEFTVTPSKSWTCYGASVAASAVLGCPGPTETSTTTVEQGSFDGRPAIVLLTSGSSYGSDTTFTFTSRRFLVPDTLLPMGYEVSGSMSFGPVVPTSERSVYRHEFTDGAALPPDFFAPASIGYVEPDVEAPLRGASDIAVYWLGKQVPASADLPGLVLAKVTAAEQGRGPGYRYILQYASADDRFGPAAVLLQLWNRTAWDRGMGQTPRIGGLRPPWESPCWIQEDVALLDGRATIFSGFEEDTARIEVVSSSEARSCPSAPPDHFSAHAYVGDSVLLIDMPGRNSVREGHVKSPYNTRAGVEAIVRALRPRQP